MEFVIRYCFKLIRFLLGSLAMLLLVGGVLLSLPAVQQVLLRNTLAYLQTKTSYRIQCAKFRFTWLQYVTLEGITVRDPENKPLIEMDSFQGKCNVLRFLLHSPAVVDSISMAGVRIYVEEHAQQEWNIKTLYTKVIFPFLPEKTADWSIKQIQLNDCQLSYKHPVKQQTFEVTHLQLAIDHFLSVSNVYSGTLTLSYEATNLFPCIIKNCTTHFAMAEDRIILTDCKLHTMHSHIWGDFKYQCTHQSALWKASKEPMTLEILLHDATLAPVELSKISNCFKGTWPFQDAWPSNKWNGRCRLVGNRQQLQLTGHVSTPIGSVQANATLQNLGKQSLTYQGKVMVEQLNVSLLFPKLPITMLSAEASVTGSGIGSGHTYIDAAVAVAAMQIAAYTYKDIAATCSFSPVGINFKLNSKDRNALLAIAGRYRFSSLADLQVEGTTIACCLDKLGITPLPLTVSTKFSLQLHNIVGGYPQGRLDLNQFVLQNATKQVKSQHIAIRLTQKEKNALFTLFSPLLDMRLQGHFTLPALSYHLRYLIERLRGNQLVLPEKIAIQYSLHCKAITPFLNGFLPDFYLSKDTFFRGHFSYDSSYQFAFYLPKVETLCFNQFRVEKAKIALNMRHLMDPKKRFLQLAIASEAQNWYKKFQTDQLTLQLLIDKDKITFSNKLSLLKYGSKLSVEAAGNLGETSIVFQLLPSSKCIIKDKMWRLHMAQPILWTKEGISIKQLSLINGSEAIYIDGQLREGESCPLRCTIHNVAVDTFLKAVDGNFKAVMDAHLVARWQAGHLVSNATFQLKACTIASHSIGDCKGSIDWNTINKHVKLEGVLQDSTQSVLQISGLYKPFQKEHSLQCMIALQQMDLKWLNPLVVPVFSEVSGKLSGNFQLVGTLAAPILQGRGQIEHGQLKVDYLNTIYKVAGPIQFQDNVLYIDRLWLHDFQTGHATFSGQIALQKEFPLRLSGKVYDLHLLDTKQTYGTNFYGTLYATGSITIAGNVRNLLFTIQATANKGTFAVVANEQNNMGAHTQLVRFIDNQGGKNLDTRLLQPKEQGQQIPIQLLLNVTLLPSVQVKLQLHPYNNYDLLQGRGEGKIQLEVGTHQKLHMLGNYRFQSGSCAISVYDLIPKTFTILPSSQIHFNGYVQESIADIQASYTQLASIGNSKCPIPVDISLCTYGSLTNPRITYALSFPDKGIAEDLYTNLKEISSRVLLDKSYRNKQILSILITKRICDEKKIGGWDALRASMNDLLTQQLQNLAFVLDRKLGVEADLAIDQWGEIDFLQKTRVKISYLLFSEQLKVSSTLGEHSKFINDWEISYKIPKMHNTSINFYQKPLRSNPSQQSNLFGITFTYSKRFW
ncbi:translocation/assembly module TamB domain-containing protein [Candidatus Cardinium hertigii]|uniref:Translocation and assembly module TamB C-terminal domain-containing protein n=1 Tax=Candidatus Cardinium hertigii TaxID=247481 RepID=A0A2Z3LJ37_9BACT|nr:translocation/assembly module TamB domain-containing protein [Candidatus Cardinium hertigii]AWN82060.1 hypothetical protein DK880_00751 [Candidatus Cardinium hertigii]